MHHDASRDAPPTFVIKAHAKDKHGGAATTFLCKNLMEHVKQGSMEVTQSKVIKWETPSCKKMCGREHLDGATPWSMRSQSNKEAWSALEKAGAERGSKAPRPLCPGRAASPFILPLGARLPQVSHSSSSLFVFLSSKSKTSRNIELAQL
jgi:hypothetical protein